MSTENEGRKAREWVAALYNQTGLLGGLFESEAEANRCGNTFNNEKVHVREVLPGEPAGSARTFGEWWGEQQHSERYGKPCCVGIAPAGCCTYKSEASIIWNAAREGMVPAPRELTPFKKWWNSLPTHAGSDPDTFRVIAGECVHVNTAIAVWTECEGVRGGGK